MRLTKEKVLELITNPEVYKHINTQIVQKLIDEMVVISSMGKRGNYYGIPHLLLQHGHLFKPVAHDIPMGAEKQCFSNSQKLNLYRDLLYAEGYFWHGIPILHGWNIADKKALDTTLRIDCNELFGIVFSSEYVLKKMLKEGAYTSLVDDWSNNWPLLFDENTLKQALHPDWSSF